MYRIAILALLLFAGFGEWALAQNGSDTSHAKEIVEQNRYLKLQSAFEGPIDSQKYIVGPGDGLVLSVLGSIENSISIFVDPEGYAFIPTVGEVFVSGLTLADAASQIESLAKQKYSGGTISVRLSVPRLFRVTLSGSVNEAGRYVVSAMTRVSDLLEMAGGAKFSEEPKDTTPDGRPITQPPKAAPLRGMPLVHRTGDTTIVDLESFYQNGERSGNPYLQDGDILVVPYWSSRRGVIRISGALQQPLVVRFVPGDRLRTILRLSGGLAPTAKGTVELSSIDSSTSKRSIREFDKVWMGSGDPGPQLQPDDQIFVPYETDQLPRGVVTVQGEVKFPGDYPVDEKTIRLSDVLHAVGGLTSLANTEEVQVIRRSLLSIPDPEFNRLYGLKKDEMSWSENEYMKAKRRDLEPRIVVDVTKLGIGSVDAGGNVVLLDGDIIRVPKKIVTIKVLGQVIKPGLIVYTVGKDFHYYIDQSGGFTSKARRSQVRIIKAQSGQWLKASSSTPVDVGDTIFIPESEDTDWWMTYKDFMLVLSEFATLAIAYYTIAKH